MAEFEVGDVVQWDPANKHRKGWVEQYKSEGPFVVMETSPYLAGGKLQSISLRLPTFILHRMDGSILEGNRQGNPSEWNDWFAQWAFVKDEFLTAVRKRGPARAANHL